MTHDVSDSDTRRCSLIELTVVRDERGQLTVGELGDGLPFRPARVFVLSDVPPGAIRAQHANRTCDQVLICVSGRCTVDVEDAAGQARHELTGPQLALVVPAGVWLTCRDFSADASLLVLAARGHDPDDQITEHNEFLAHIAAGNAGRDSVADG